MKIFLIKILLFVVATFSCGNCFAQTKGPNIVPNGGFEKHRNKSNVVTNAVPWKNVGTVDYFMKPEKTDTSQFKGAHKGVCYAGLRFQKEYKEYMFVQLTETLEKNSIYHFRMFVRLLASSTVTIKQIGVYFTDEPFKYGMKFFDDEKIDSTNKKGIATTNNWIPIEGDFTSQGGEKYIIIGNFSDNTKADMVNKNKFDLFGFKEAYYFIDDVSLRKKIILADTTKKIIIAKTPFVSMFPDSVFEGQKIVLYKIQFENGSAKLKKASETGLNELFKFLNEHPFMEVQITGHTDNAGYEGNNMKLSVDRAKIVFDYLKKEGVTNPISHKGFGAAQPIAPNDNEENKAKNRRVELAIIKI